MGRSNILKGVLQWALATLFFACGGEPNTEQSLPKRPAPTNYSVEVAISFDELPYQLNLDKVPSQEDGVFQKQVTDQLVQHLVAQNVPAAVFVHCDLLPPEQGLVGQWADAGFTIGNHGANPIDANTTPIQAWSDDVMRCANKLKKKNLKHPQWFRFPNLQRGWTSQRDRALQSAIQELEHRIVPASIPVRDDLYNQVYERAIASQSSGRAQSVVSEYVKHVRESVLQADKLARTRRGMAIPHIARFHVNRLNADVMDQVLAALRSDGVRIISVHEAVQDPLYTSKNAYFGRSEKSWIDQVAPLPPPERGSWFGQEAERITHQYPNAFLDRRRPEK